MQTPTAVAVDGVIPLGSLIRRYGCDVALNGNTVNITGAGYYDVDASVTVAPAAVGTVTITSLRTAWPSPARPPRRPPPLQTMRLISTSRLSCDRSAALRAPL